MASSGPSFHLDLVRYRLAKDDKPVRLERQPMELLILLAERPRELVTREQIAARLWGQGVFVDTDQSINRIIRKLRVALGDDSENPQYIETVVGKGYRLIGDMHVLEKPRETPEAIAQPPRSRTVRWRVLGLISIMVLVAAGVWLWKHSSPRPSASTGIQSLAVLPLDNLSGDPNQQYFADGMTDELITELALVPQLRVISRTSVMQYRNTQESLPDIARRLHVDAIVEGTVVTSSQRVRITTQLVDARTDRHLWAHEFERPLSDVVQLQDEVAREIARHIQRELAPARNLEEVSAAAHDAYLRGLYFYDMRSANDALRSEKYFREAIGLSPKYAAAYAGLANTLVEEAYLGASSPDSALPAARTAAEQAIQLNPESSEAYIALGAVDLSYDYNWPSAGKNLQPAIQLNPNSALAEIFYSVYLACIGQPDQAVTEAQRALELDPLSFFINRTAGSALYFDRHFDEALTQLQFAKELRGSPAVIDNWISWIEENHGHRDAAVESDLLSLAEHGISSATLKRYRSAYATGGWKNYWRTRLRDLLSAPQTPCSPYDIGLAYLRTGSPAEGLHSLNSAASQRCVWSIFTKVDPYLDSARNRPEYSRLLERLHLTP